MSKTLECVEQDLIDLIYRRYWQTPLFSHTVIHRFANNISELKKLAAQDYEDILQCSIPYVTAASV